MLEYNGVITLELIVAFKPLNITNGNVMETLRFQDKDLQEEYVASVQEKLEEHFGSDALIHAAYQENRAVFDMTVIFNKKEDKSKMIDKYRSLFEEYYKENI
jgi:hypothetical protein